MTRMNIRSFLHAALLTAALAGCGILQADEPAPASGADAPKKLPRDRATVAAEHSDIGVDAESAASHTQHPDAQWFPDAGFGLFIHWGIASVKAMNISWPMIPGRALAKTRVTDPAERARIIREEIGRASCRER